MTREANARTAGALDSITRWIEKTEDRLSSSERGSAERQERTTNVIARLNLSFRIVDCFSIHTWRRTCLESNYIKSKLSQVVS